MMFRSILCPVDFSECSRQALRYADDLAHRTGGRLSVLYVNDPTVFLAAAAALHRRPHALRRSQNELERFVEASISIGVQQRPVCTVVHGHPAAEILKTIRRLKSDLVVMGTHGLSGLDRLFFGSTTDHVLRRVTAPLLAVPSSNRSTTSPPSRTGRLPAVERVLVPLDLDGEWKHELRGGVDVARVFGAQLLLVYVVPRTQAPPWLRQNVAAYDRKRLRRARRTLQQVRADVPSDIRTASHAVIGNPADEIAALAANDPRSLVVMALRGGLRARHGSTTHHVLTRAVRPVLVLPR